MAKTFRENGFDDPILEKNGKKFLGLQRQIKGYVDLDPATKKQSCIPLQVFKYLLENSTSQIDIAIAQLTTGALFFAMRSCEYSHTDGDTIDNQKRKTKILRVRNFRFFNDKKQLDIYDSTGIQNADSIIITFEFQKNRTKFESIKQDSNESEFCPVKIWSSVISRILNYPKHTINSPINIVRHKRQYSYIKSSQIRTALRTTVDKIGKETLGFDSSTVGTRSLRTSFAMLLHLNKIDLPTIMRMGRWKSAAVMEYVRSNIDNFSKNISRSIADATSGQFYTLPSYIQTIENQNND